MFCAGASFPEKFLHLQSCPKVNVFESKTCRPSTPRQGPRLRLGRSPDGAFAGGTGGCFSGIGVRHRAPIYCGHSSPWQSHGAFWLTPVRMRSARRVTPEEQRSKSAMNLTPFWLSGMIEKGAQSINESVPNMMMIEITAIKLVRRLNFFT